MQPSINSFLRCVSSDLNRKSLPFSLVRDVFYRNYNLGFRSKATRTSYESRQIKVSLATGNVILLPRTVRSLFLPASFPPSFVASSFPSSDTPRSIVRFSSRLSLYPLFLSFRKPFFRLSGLPRSLPIAPSFNLTTVHSAARLIRLEFSYLRRVLTSFLDTRSLLRFPLCRRSSTGQFFLESRRPN